MFQEYFGLISGVMDTGLKWLSMTGYRPTEEVRDFTSVKTEKSPMNSGALSWRKHMQSNQ